MMLAVAFWFACTAHAWDMNLDPATVKVQLSELAVSEVVRFLSPHPISSLKEIEALTPDRGDFVYTLADLRRFVSSKLVAVDGPKLFVVEAVPGLTFRQRTAQSWLLSSLLGQTLEQNLDGAKLYVVQDRGGRLELGARYSQTSQGGNFHTDGVNVMDGYDVFLLHAVTPALEGGDSLFLDGAEVFRRLNSTVEGRAAVETLVQPFAFEWKGVKVGQYYSAPILRRVQAYANNSDTHSGACTGGFDVVMGGTASCVGEEDAPVRVHWRYLRSYVEEAAKRGGRAGLTDAQLRALDTLDRVLESPDLQFKLKLESGETAVINDREIFHGRTSFLDACGAVTLETFFRTTADAPRPVSALTDAAACTVDVTDAQRLMAAGHDASLVQQLGRDESVVVRRTYIRTWVNIDHTFYAWDVPSPRTPGYMSVVEPLSA